MTVQISKHALVADISGGSTIIIAIITVVSRDITIIGITEHFIIFTATKRICIFSVAAIINIITVITIIFVIVISISIIGILAQ